ELQVMCEFAEAAPALGYTCEVLDATGVLARSRAVKPDGLLGGLYSTAELIVDPREAIARLAGYLREAFAVEFRFQQTVTTVEASRLRANDDVWTAERILVCSGADLDTLFPDPLRQSGLKRCKLQMMRTVPQPSGWRMGPMLATGLSLRHYPAFAACPS